MGVENGAKLAKVDGKAQTIGIERPENPIGPIESVRAPRTDKSSESAWAFGSGKREKALLWHGLQLATELGLENAKPEKKLTEDDPG